MGFAARLTPPDFVTALQHRYAALRERIAFYERQRGFERTVRQLRAAPVDALPAALVSELYAYWGDPPTPASESYLRSCIAEAARARGPVVQCGSSVMTLLLGHLCQASDDPRRQLWCLEHDPHWANLVRSWLTQFRIGATHVIGARPQLFDGYSWYAVDPQRLADRIGLLICDGGRATPAGLIGALERLGERMAEDGVILARQVTRAQDLQQVTAWAKAHGASCVVIDKAEGFLKITRSRPETAR